MLRRLAYLAAIAAIAVINTPTIAHAQAPWPDRPIRILLPFSTGGGPDLVVRLIAEPLAKRLGQPVVVDNRPGANGLIALEALAKAAPDGATLGIGDLGSFAINPHLHKSLPYDPQKSFTPITTLYTTPFFIAASNASQARTWKELAEAAKAQPGKLNFGSSGIGSPTHLGWELLKRAAGIDLTHVPHKNLGALMTSLLTGDVASAVLGYPALAGAAKAGKLRILAVANDVRSPAAPDIPTLAEAGGPADFRILTWVALIGPRGLPADVQRRLVAEVTAILNEPEVRARVGELAFTPSPTGPDVLVQRIAAELPRYGEIIRQAGVARE